MKDFEKELIKKLRVNSLRDLCSHVSHDKFGIYKKDDVFVIPAESKADFLANGNSWNVRKDSEFIELSNDGSFGSNLSYEFIELGQDFLEIYDKFLDIANSLTRARNFLEI